MIRGEIRLVWFPFSARESASFKRRPVLVLSATGTPPDEAVLVVMITSNGRRVSRPGPGDVVIPNWAACGLRRPSVVRTRRLWTAETRDFAGPVLGTLSGRDLDDVIDQVRLLMK